MLVLKIIGIVLLALFLFTLVHIKARLRVINNSVSVKAYLGAIGYTVYDQSKPKKEKKKKSDKKNDIDDDNEELEEKTKDGYEKKGSKKEKKKMSLKENIVILKDLISSSGKALGLIKKHLKFIKISTDISVGGPDAHQIALTYANLSSLMINSLNLLGKIFKIKIKKIEIKPNFLSEESDYNANIVVKIRIVWILVAGFYLLKAFIKKVLKSKKRKGGISHEPTTAN